LVQFVTLLIDTFIVILVNFLCFFTVFKSHIVESLNPAQKWKEKKKLRTKYICTISRALVNIFFL